MTFADRHGNVILALPRGRAAGYRWPQYSIHRGELQLALLRLMPTPSGLIVRVASTTTHSSPAAARLNAVASPPTPPPTTMIFTVAP